MTKAKIFNPWVSLSICSQIHGNRKDNGGSPGLDRGIKLIFNGDHISLEVDFKGPNVILGLYKCNYSLTVKREFGTAAG